MLPSAALGMRYLSVVSVYTHRKQMRYPNFLKKKKIKKKNGVQVRSLQLQLNYRKANGSLKK